jgi:GH24 family phage-related lysozyme (muramidase)
MGYGKIVQEIEANKSEKNREKEETEALIDGKKETNPEKNAVAGKPLSLSEAF